MEEWIQIASFWWRLSGERSNSESLQSSEKHCGDCHGLVLEGLSTLYHQICIRHIIASAKYPIFLFFQHKSGPKHLSKQRQHYWSSVGSSWLRTEQEPEESKVKLFPSRRKHSWRKHSWRKKEGNVIYYLSLINQLSIIYQSIS